jgi:ATP-dependent DNA helicase DinG
VSGTVGTVSPAESASHALATVVAAMSGGGEERPGQQQMCEAVAGAIDQDRHLVVAAGTGTGKSMAYLAPLAVSGRKAVVTTATKALQDQLVDKDLPQLAEALATPIEFAVLKGRSNYICRKKLIDLAAASSSEQGQLIAADSAAEAGRIRGEIVRLAAWADETSDGDRAGLEFEPSPRAWEAVSVSGRECPGAQNCPAGQECFAERARNKAADVDVVVVNHHLYCLHVFTDAEILPPHDAVVFDEAHTLEDIAAGAAGVTITPGRFTSAARTVRAVAGDSRAAAEVNVAGDMLREALRPHRDRLLAPLPDDLVDIAAVCRARLLAADAEVRDASGDETRQRMARRQLAAIVEDLGRASDSQTEDAVWVDGTDRSPAWRTAPVDVAPMLESRLWAHTPAVLTSATIPINLADTLGIPGEACDVLDVGSPFDFRNCGLLYCAKSLPNPNASGRDRLAHSEIARMAVAAGGRTLALFTSYAAMDRAADAVREATGLHVYTQRDFPKPELLRRFSEEEESCLFATMGMWQGVDVPGRSLSLLVVDRIPFARPDDPLISARRERHGDEAFRRVDVPRAAAILAQGIGRLIRCAEDRGVVAVLDSRLATADYYRHDLLEGLPPFKRTIDIEEVEAFLTSIRRSAEADHRQP